MTVVLIEPALALTLATGMKFVIGVIAPLARPLPRPRPRPRALKKKKDRNKEEKKYNTRREIGKTNETVSELLMRVLLLELAGVRLLTEARASPLDLALCRDREHCKKEGSKQKKNQPRKEAMEANEMVMILKKSKNETKRARRVKRKYMSKKCKHNKEIQKGRESKVDEIKRNDWGNQ